MASSLDIFLVCAPGLETALADEAREAGFQMGETVPGGVSISGDWLEVWRANLGLRGATRVLVRLASFRALHPAQLDKRARKLPWGDWLRPDIAFRVEAVSHKSRIYHAGAARQRVERAVSDAIGAQPAKDAPVVLKVRIDDDLCTISVDSSGESLHKRGLKLAVNKAPMRETLAAMFLRQCGFNAQYPVFDPMCGSGTFVIEAAEIAAGLQPGRARDFAFQNLATHDAAIFAQLHKAPHDAAAPPRFFGSDRDAGAVRMSRENADRAGVAAATSFEAKPISEVSPPCEAPGLVIVNPPYGGRIGNKKPLFGLYAAFGQVMAARFAGWRIGLITSDAKLAHTTGLRFETVSPVINHGGIKVRLYQTAPLS